MNFTFERDRGDNGALLPVIPEISSGRIQLLEGRNGIGKSLAIRILEIATGGHPYAADSAAWQALSASLGTTTVVAHTAEHDLEIQLEPSRWPADPADDATDPIAGALLDGVEVSADDVRRRLQVVRIAGEESLSQALGGNFAQLSQQTAQLAQELAPRTQRLLDSLDQALDVLQGADVKPLRLKRDRLAEAETQVERVAADLAEIQSELDEVRSARDAMKALASLDREGPPLRERIREMTDALGDADLQREEAVQTLARVAADQDREQVAVKEFERIEKLIRRRERAVTKVDDSVLDLANRVEVADDPEAAAQAQEDCRSELASSSARRSELGRHDMVRSLISDLLARVEGASEHLDDHALLFHVGGVAVNLMALRATLVQRETELSSTNVAREVDELDERIRELIGRRETLDDLVTALAERYRLRGKVVEALNELREVEATLATSATAEFREAREKLDSAVSTTQRLTVERLQAQHALSELSTGLTTSELAARVGAVESRYPDAGGEDLNAEANRLQEAVDAAARSAVDAEEERRVLFDEVQVAEAQRRNSIDSLNPDGPHGWLATRFDISSLSDWDAATFADALGALNTMRDRVDRSINNVQAVSTGLLDVGQHLAGIRSLGAGTPLQEAVVRACERRLVEQFSEPEVRDALFSGEVVDNVDIRELLVSWHRNGRQMIRPLSAFSSGEQAFAYARARIASLEPAHPGQHRLLVLDEFSAFVAGDRRALLYRLLDEVVARGSASQVLLIVPLAQDFSDPAVRAAAENDPVLRRRMNQVDRRGYFIEAVK